MHINKRGGAESDEEEREDSLPLQEERSLGSSVVQILGILHP